MEKTSKNPHNHNSYHKEYSALDIPEETLSRATIKPGKKDGTYTTYPPFQKYTNHHKTYRTLEISHL